MAKKYYAIIVGEKTGIYYEEWDVCKEWVLRFPGAKFKGRKSFELAKSWYLENGGDSALLENNEVDSKTNQMVPASTLPADVPKSVASPAEYPQKTNADIIDKKKIVDKLAKKLLARSERLEPICSTVEEYCAEYGYKNLSEDQKRAVQAIDGKHLLFAVPGSGKTTVIIARNGYLLYGNHDKYIKPEEIVNLTFTRAAAKEMESRFREKFAKGNNDDNVNLPDFKTIHSFCFQKLLKPLSLCGFTYPKYVVNQENPEFSNKENTIFQKNIIKKVIGLVNEERLKNFLDTIDSSDETCDIIATLITTVKNRMLQDSQIAEKFIKINKDYVEVSPIIHYYNDELKAADCMDYDDMLIYSLKGLKKHPELVTKIQSAYRYWSIDETQDNSKLQNELISLIVGDKGNLFVVGDDDQSIYNFRGAEPELLLRYGALDSVNTLVMGTNYRSDKHIVNVAKEFVEVNKNRADKAMIPFSKNEGAINFYTKLVSYESQMVHILSVAKKYENIFKASGTKNSLAVIYRLNASCLPLMFLFKKNGIKFKVSKDYTEIINSKIYGDVIGTMRLFLSLDSLDDFFKYQSCANLHLRLKYKDEAIELQKSGDHRPILDILKEVLEKNTSKSLKKFCEAKKMFDSLENTTAFAAAEIILKYLGISDLIPSAASRLRIYGILSACSAYNTVKDFIKDVDALNKELENKLVKTEDANQYSVTLTSMHSAKGLEFEHVIIIDSFESIMNISIDKEPYELDFDDPEEERRLFYVAVTRAKKILDICVVNSYYGNKETPSSFISELARIFELQSGEYLEEKGRDITCQNDGLEFELKCETFYGVKKGFNPGIYQNFNDCKKQVEHFSKAEYRSFTSYDEAYKYVYDRLPNVEEKPLKYARLANFLETDSCIGPKIASELPPAVNAAILDWFKVGSIKELAPNMLSTVKCSNINFKKNMETNYHGCVDNYILSYLPVNFYKIFTPLWECLQKNLLKSNIDVLELGPGPGTSTMALMFFYYILARENPEKKFSVSMTLVEREEDFLEPLKYMTDYVKKRLENNNLTFEINIIKQDIFEYISKIPYERYDIVMESNVINMNESIAGNLLDILKDSLEHGLRQDGLAMLIEPGDKLEYDNICKLMNSIKTRKNSELVVFSNPRRTSVNVQNMAIVKDVIELGIRKKPIKEHWFTYAVLRKALV